MCEENKKMKRDFLVFVSMAVIGVIFKIFC